MAGVGLKKLRRPECARPGAQRPSQAPEAAGTAPALALPFPPHPAPALTWPEPLHFRTAGFPPGVSGWGGWSAPDPGCLRYRATREPMERAGRAPEPGAAPETTAARGGERPPASGPPRLCCTCSRQLSPLHNLFAEEAPPPAGARAGGGSWWPIPRRPAGRPSCEPSGVSPGSTEQPQTRPNHRRAPPASKRRRQTPATRPAAAPGSPSLLRLRSPRPCGARMVCTQEARNKC